MPVHKNSDHLTWRILSLSSLPNLHTFPPTGITNHLQLALALLPPSVLHLYLPGEPFTHAHIMQLARLHQLRSLQFQNNAAFSSPSVSIVSAVRALQRLVPLRYVRFAKIYSGNSAQPAELTAALNDQLSAHGSTTSASIVSRGSNE